MTDILLIIIIALLAYVIHILKERFQVSLLTHLWEYPPLLQGRLRTELQATLILLFVTVRLKLSVTDFSNTLNYLTLRVSDRR